MRTPWVYGLLALAACQQTDIVADIRSVDANLSCPDRPELPGEGSPQARADRWFGRGLCNCDDAALSAPFVADGFDSRNGPYQTGDGQVQVGFNGRVDASAPVRIEGDMIAATEVLSSTDMTVGGDFNIGADLLVDGDIVVGGNLYVNGQLRAANLTVSGALSQPDGATRTISGTEQIGSERVQAMPIDPPCACDALPSFSNAITAGQQNAINEAQDRFANVNQAAAATLDCGVYAFSTLAGLSRLTLTLLGPTQIYVAGDIALEGLTINLGLDASLDLYVGGGWAIRGPLQIGDPARPSASRIYTDASGTIDLELSSSLYARILAPRAELVSPGGLDVFGSLFIRRLSGAGAVTIHQDRAP